MTEPTRDNIERLDECLLNVNVKFSFWFDSSSFETNEEIENILHYCESGELEDLSDSYLDEFISMIHQEFFDPPHGSPLGMIDQPQGIQMDTEVRYD